MKSLVNAAIAILLTAHTTLSVSAEMPYEPTHYEAMRNTGKPFAVVYKGSLPTTVPTDPLIYRFYELVNVYGTTFKELIHEEFGDGIMSAIDFKMDVQREPNPAGDRVSIMMSGKFLPYKTY
jgi:cyanase